MRWRPLDQPRSSRTATNHQTPRRDRKRSSYYHKATLAANAAWCPAVCCPTRPGTVTGGGAVSRLGGPPTRLRVSGNATGRGTASDSNCQCTSTTSIRTIARHREGDTRWREREVRDGLNLNRAREGGRRGTRAGAVRTTARILGDPDSPCALVPNVDASRVGDHEAPGRASGSPPHSPTRTEL